MSLSIDRGSISQYSKLKTKTKQKTGGRRSSLGPDLAETAKISKTSAASPWTSKGRKHEGVNACIST